MLEQKQWFLLYHIFLNKPVKKYVLMNAIGI